MMIFEYACENSTTEKLPEIPEVGSFLFTYNLNRGQIMHDSLVFNYYTKVFINSHLFYFIVVAETYFYRTSGCT